MRKVPVTPEKLKMLFFSWGKRQRIGTASIKETTAVENTILAFLVRKGPFSKPITPFSEGEKPPKIRKKSSQEQSSWELLALLPLKKIKGTLVRKVPGNLHSQEFVFFLVRFVCPLLFHTIYRVSPFCLGGGVGWSAVFCVFPWSSLTKENDLLF